MSKQKNIGEFFLCVGDDNKLDSKGELKTFNSKKEFSNFIEGLKLDLEV